MANAEHVKLVRQGKDAIDEWRKRKGELHQSLSLDLVEADLAGADLQHANLAGADLKRAGLAGADLRAADLKNASLLGVTGLRLDSTFVEGVRFSHMSTAWWLTLRREYTGAMLLFHMVLLLAFITPYVAKSLMWRGVYEVERVTRTEVEEKATALEQELGEPPEALLESPEKMEALTYLQRTEVIATSKALSGVARVKEWPKWKVWQLLIGVDRPGPWYWLTALLILAYNGCRMLLTYCVAKMREEQETTGSTPQFRALWRDDFIWWRPLAPLLRAYGWLFYVHVAASLLLYLAVVSGLWNVWQWLMLEVHVPGIG